MDILLLPWVHLQHMEEDSVNSSKGTRIWQKYFTSSDHADKTVLSGTHFEVWDNPYHCFFINGTLIEVIQYLFYQSAVHLNATWINRISTRAQLTTNSSAQSVKCCQFTLRKKVWVLELGPTYLQYCFKDSRRLYRIVTRVFGNVSLFFSVRKVWTCLASKEDTEN